MGSKGDKCCCCPGVCLNLGPHVVVCPYCPEISLIWRIAGFTGTVSGGGGQAFGCCVPGFEAFLFTDDYLGCAWTSVLADCGNSAVPPKYYQWTMELDSSGIATLSLEFFPNFITGWTGATLVWVCKDFNCLCPNKFLRERYYDSGDMGIEGCGIPEGVCVNPFETCCKPRRKPLPRTLRVFMSPSSPTASCACSTGNFDINWDPIEAEWSGSGDHCGSLMVMKLACGSFLRGNDAVFRFSLQLGPVGSADCAGTYTDTGALSIQACDPIHYQFTRSFPHCCGPIFAGTLFDVMEIL